MTLFAYLKPTFRYKVQHPQRWTYRIDYHASGPELYRALETFIQGPDLSNQTDSDNPRWFTGLPSLNGTRIFRPTLFPETPLSVLQVNLMQALAGSGYPTDVSFKLASAIVDERTWWLYARTRTVTWEHPLAYFFSSPKVDDHFLIRVESLSEKENRLKEAFRATLHITPFLGAMLQGAEILNGETILGDKMPKAKRAREGVVLLLSILIPRIFRKKGAAPTTADDLVTLNPRLTRDQAEAVLRASRKIEPNEISLLRNLALRLKRDGNLILTKNEKGKLSNIIHRLQTKNKLATGVSLPKLTTVDDAIRVLENSGTFDRRAREFLAKLNHRTLLLSQTERRSLRDLLNKLEEPQRIAWANQRVYQKFQKVLIGKGYGSGSELMPQELGGALFLSRHLDREVKVIPEGATLSSEANLLSGSPKKTQGFSPDFVIDGKSWDFYLPGVSPKEAVGHILVKKRNQASCLLIDLENVAQNKLTAYRIALDLYSRRDVGRSLQRLIFVRRRGTAQVLGKSVHHFELVADIPRGPLNTLQLAVDVLEKEIDNSSLTGGLIRGTGTHSLEPKEGEPDED